MKTYYKSLISFIVGLLIAFIVAVSKNIFAQTTAYRIYHILTDAFFIPGALLFCLGILVASSNEGTFDMLRYGTVRFFSLFRRDHNNVKFKTYYEYVSDKHEKKQSFWYMVFIGLLFIGISMIFLYLYTENEAIVNMNILGR